MIQHFEKMAGELNACRCGKQPRHYHVRGKDLHFLECAPCTVRTAKFRTLQEAVAAWEDGNTESFLPKKVA